MPRGDASVREINGSGTNRYTEVPFGADQLSVHNGTEIGNGNASDRQAAAPFGLMRRDYVPFIRTVLRAIETFINHLIVSGHLQ